MVKKRKNEKDGKTKEQESDQNAVGHRKMMNDRKEWGRTWGIYWDGSSNREEREINRWIDTNALLAFFFLLISSLQLKRLSVSQKRLSQQGTVSIICFLLCLFSLQQLNRRPLNVCRGILKNIYLSCYDSHYIMLFTVIRTYDREKSHHINKVSTPARCLNQTSWSNFQRLFWGNLAPHHVGR